MIQVSVDVIFPRLWGKHLHPQPWGWGTSDDCNILLFYFIWNRILTAALNSAILTQQWKCHPVRQEHHFLQHLGFLWRSPIIILNESMVWTGLFFLSEMEHLFYSRSNDRVLQKKESTSKTVSKCWWIAVPSIGNRTFPFNFIAL